MRENTGDDQVFALSVHPSVVFKLGEDLITDDVQALTELMKNAYDADSMSVSVRIDTNVWTKLRSGEILEPTAARKLLAEREQLLGRIERLEELLDENSPPTDRDELLEEILVLQARLAAVDEPVRGIIEVSDRGTGMTVEDIRRGWLTVSASPKRQMKAEGKVTATHRRTPLGDKGLGRLGAQRLGRVLDLRTRTANDTDSLHATLFWDDFTDVDALSDVPIRIRRFEETGAPGSRITIRGLHHPEHWDESRPLFQRDIAEMISPYGDEHGFRITMRVNGIPVDLREVTDQALAISPVSYELSYRDGILKVIGKMRAEYLKPDRNPEGAADWNEFIAADNGAAFLAWFKANRKPKSERLRLSDGDDLHLCGFESSTRLDDMPKVALNPDGSPADPGPFDGRVDMIARRTAREMFEGGKDYEKWVEAVTGVRLYRDRFGIRMRDDWLRLGAQWTTGSSYYTLRPDNVVGYINLTAQHNAALEETSNREEFLDLPAYRNFQQLLAEWQSLSELFQSAVRRGYNEYVKELKQDRNGISPRSSSKELARDIASQFDKAQEVNARANSARDSIRRAQAVVEDFEAQRDALGKSYLVTPELIAANSHLASELRRTMGDLESRLDLVQRASAEIADRREVVELLLERLVDAERQVQEVWEVVSLGMTAEAVSHEVLNVTDRLRERSRQIARYNDAEVHNPRFGEYVEQVKAAAQSMHKQVSHLDSSMRYVRDRREQVNVGDAAKQSAEYFNARWHAQRLAMVVTVEETLAVKISRGKLAQVIDNLVLNSEFWVLEALRRGWIDVGEVRLRVDRHGFTVEDNGPGVDASVEELLFDPFVTRKPSRRGRGLGLFVVRQLLESEGFAISLDPTRNSRGNRYRFRVDLRS
ncbi:sensor histidine kinase [Cellulomonas sp. C5510]|uniref:sensor histidine kinase n=1 Tax=Cellulomonas sp. C5510 TaxID=2871170 RepID=UPI001C950523|nr:HAMP domain-containing sensor histidine kinase [Cellulomonas sp. C5510]QZN85422.1 HAMP domain-containing histidine kinase [Cellulomonas sp. C5510]